MLSLIFGKKKKRVMMIDDEIKVLKLFEGIFKNHPDVEIVGVSNKKEFLENIDKVDGVVSDYHMQNVTEISFEKVRIHCDQKRIPLLLITGDIYPYYDYQLSKPVSGKTLVTNVETMLKRGYVPSKKNVPKAS